MQKHIVLAIAVLGAGILGTLPANAQRRETVTTSGPNRELLQSGIFALGVPYVASVIVAASSDRAEDKNLYIPVAGPWMDYANRGSCGNAGEPTRTVTVSSDRRVFVSPYYMGSSYGVSAFARF